MRHRFHRKGAELRVDQDVWLCALDLALSQGWKPAGVEPAAESYVTPRGQIVSTADARELARCLTLALEDVPDEVAPLSDQPFGDENTLALLSAAAKGPPPTSTRVAAAREILSGPPKAEAASLVEFLHGGSFTLSAGK